MSIHAPSRYSTLSDGFIIIQTPILEPSHIAFFKYKNQIIGNATVNMSCSASVERLNRLRSKVAGVYGWNVIDSNCVPIEQVVKEIRALSEKQKFDRAVSKLKNRHSALKLSLTGHMFYEDELKRLEGQYNEAIELLEQRYNQRKSV